MNMKVKWILISGIGLLGAGAAIYFFYVRGKTRESDKYGNLKLKATGQDKAISAGVAGGVQTSKGEQSTAVVEPNFNNPFDLNYANDVKKWVAPKTLIVLKDQFAKQYAKELYDAKGWFKDNVEAVQNVFEKKAKDKVHVSNVSAAFWKDQKKDLFDYLSSFLSEEEMEKYVHKPVRNLPNYRLA
jgi:nucleoside phosphorylase